MPIMWTHEEERMRVRIGDWASVIRSSANAGRRMSFEWCVGRRYDCDIGTRAGPNSGHTWHGRSACPRA